MSEVLSSWGTEHPCMHIPASSKRVPARLVAHLSLSTGGLSTAWLLQEGAPSLQLGQLGLVAGRQRPSPLFGEEWKLEVLCFHSLVHIWSLN